MAAHDALPERAPEASAEPRQRWRSVFRRDAAASAIEPRALQEAWEAGLAASTLPLLGRAGPGGLRPRISFAAGLPAGMAAERDVADIVLTERLPVDAVRRALRAALPDGHELVDLYDVWLGEPALAAQAVGADYVVTLQATCPDPETLRAGASRLLAAERLDRTRLKGGKQTRYDLRPLLVSIEVEDDRRPIAVRIGVRFDSALGNGRPEEVVAALGEACGAPRLTATETVRLRLHLESEQAPGADGRPR
jgi:radical SAM-linked protein